MKQFIWNQEQTIAIPLSNIKSLEITTHACSSGERLFSVIAHYTILSGLTERIYESFDKGSCVQYIENIFKEEIDHEDKDDKT